MTGNPAHRAFTLIELRLVIGTALVSRPDLGNKNWDSINKALDTLGLELVPTNMPIKMLVVEKAN